MKSNKVKLKGPLKSYLRWPLFLSILLVIMTGIVFMASLTAGFVALGCLIIYLIAAFILYTRVKPTIMDELVNFALEYGQVQKRMLYQLEIPYAVMDSEGRLLWANHCFKKSFDSRPEQKPVSSLFKEVTNELLPKEDIKASVDVSYDNRFYRAEISMVTVEEFARSNTLVDSEGAASYLYTIYLFDETEIKQHLKEIENQRLVCGVIYVDNYEEALNSTEEFRRSLLASLIERKITKYMHGFDAIVTKIQRDKFQFVVQQKYLPQMQSTKFSILDEVRDINIGNEMPVTLCVGVGSHAESYNQSAEWARNAIDLALGRGGDQAVVKNKDKISYYGGKKKQVEKGTRVRARVKAHALKQLLEGKDQVVVMGHKIGDADSFGASIGIYRAARSLNKKAHIVINDVSKSVRPIKGWFENNTNYEPDMFLNETEAMEMVDVNTALVVVDVNKPSYMECPELLNKTRTIVVLDHHRQSSESVENAVLSYIEPYASSACEMVAEILQYITDGIKLRQVEADAMYAGLMIDTNNFLNKTGVRTFEAAAYLKKSGADVTKVRMIFRDDMDTYKARAEGVRKARIFDGIFAFSEAEPGELESPTVIGAQIANELLNIDGIKASFVFTKVKQVIYISARSMDEVNVQLVMERFGGGGHSTMAGAQLEDISVEAAMAKVKMQLKIMKNEGDI